MPKVVTVGSVILDVWVQLPQLPDKGGDILGSDLASTPGGGFNLAAAVARYGTRCVYAGIVGDGPNGRLVEAALTKEGVEFVGVTTGVGDTGTCLTLVEPDGERTFITVPGAEAKITSAHLARAPLTDGDYLAVSGYDLAYPGGGAAVSEWVTQLAPSVVVAFDPGPLIGSIPRDALAAVFDRANIVTLNQREARLLSGSDTSGSGLIESVIEALPSRQARVILREGSSGCVVGGGPFGEPLQIPAPVVTAVDSTGAGDAHLGVLLAALAQGSAFLDAVATANRAAAITVTRAGPATSPTRTELEGFAGE